MEYETVEVNGEVVTNVDAVEVSSEAAKHATSSFRKVSNASLGHIPRASPTQLQHSSWYLFVCDIFDGGIYSLEILLKFLNIDLQPYS